MSDYKNHQNDSRRAEVNEKKESSVSEIANSLVAFGRIQGADEIEVAIIESSEFNVDVRFGEIENLVEAGSRALGFRIIKDKKTAIATSSDLTKETLQNLVKNAVKRSTLGNPDECAGLPPLRKTQIDIASLKLFDPDISKLDSRKKISLAKETEKIALNEKKITNSHGASFETRKIKIALANSNGFLKEYDETYCSLGIGLQAGDIDNKAEGFWSCSKRFLKELESPEMIARKAVERTLRQLNPRKIKTQNVPVIFEPMMTSWLLAFLFSCISGISIYQKTSFLVDKLGEKIGIKNVTVYDDGSIPGKIGSRPFDSEGVPVSKNTVIERGILKNYLCNTYAARKLKLKSTGNADANSVGPNNFYLQSGKTSPEEIIASTKRGLLLTRTIGHGLNPVTGDISRGAFGLWIEDGKIAYPVSEITISGNLGVILNEIEIVGNDLEFRSSFSGPTIKIKELTVAGK